MTGLLSLYIKQCRREWLLVRRQPRNILYSSLMFVMLVVFFPLSLSPDPQLLRQIAPGVFWIAILLAFLMASERLFQEDYLDGVIEQWLVSGEPIGIYILSRLSVHWLLTLGSMVSLGFLLGFLFHLSLYECAMVALSFIVGTPALLCLCALAAAFCTSVQQKGVLMALILFPLVIPVMVFGSAVMNAAMQQLPVLGYLAILLALSLLTVTFLPFAIGAIIRISLSD